MNLLPCHYLACLDFKPSHFSHSSSVCIYQPCSQALATLFFTSSATHLTLDSRLTACKLDKHWLK